MIILDKYIDFVLVLALENILTLINHVIQLVLKKIIDSVPLHDVIHNFDQI